MTDTIGRGEAAGAVLSPFFSPLTPMPRRPGVEQLRDAVTATGARVFLDATTHGALMAAANFWDCYDTWDLWDGPRGDLSTSALRAGHVRRVVAAQRRLRVPVMAPTVGLQSSIGDAATLSLDLAETTRAEAPDFWVSVVGTSAFWSQGGYLDDYIGQLVNLRPMGVSLTVQRTQISYPPDAVEAEVAGVCRSAHTMSLRSEVLVQHGDLSGLPALAAGAQMLGSGWDLRQRVFAPDGLRRDTTVRRAAKRITHDGVFAVLKRPEAERLLRTDPALSRRVVPGALPADGNGLWEHHLAVLSNRVAALLALPDRPARVRWLAGEYAAAEADFRRIERLTRLEFPPAAWLDAVRQGLDAYRVSEGW